jgi:aspartyl-tRNA(Asn)/glutamyl-tRNA(Gln) amidotransferase subunit C
MPVDIDIAKVARLARIDLPEARLAALGTQLEGILEHAAEIQALDTDDVTPTAHPLPMTNAHRPDVIGETLDRDEVLAAAPDHTNGYFRVPSYLEDE